MLNAEVTPARLIRLLVSFLMAISATACGGGVGVTQFLAFEAPVVALTHVRVIDGTGGPARDDQPSSSTANALPLLVRGAGQSPSGGAKCST